MSDNIKVVVKVRPLISRELEDKQQHQWRVQSNTLYQLDSNGRDFGQAFTFDKIYNEDSKTADVYKDVAKPIVEAATAGFNGTIFAYGQTSSGKTYTMTGTETSQGIIPLSVLNLFEIIKSVPNRDFLVRVSYIEIYNETVKDLLDVKKGNIKIHETYDGCIKVDTTERVTSSPEEVLEAMREGECNRQTGSTNMNEKSSRSHSIFQITIESREHIEGTEEAGCVNVSQLNLVDLAGSERAGQTGATGLRFKEGTHINKSLSALALVIKQLSEDPNKYANYRDSKLTRILQNSLGGNAKTSIICAITPAALEETISTLQFATRAKAIKNKPEVNAVATDATMIQSLTKQLSKLQSQLESKKNLELILETRKTVEQDLQNKITNLQRLILNGFGQRSSIEQLGGARRKQPPRRITISTLHSIDEHPVPTVPKFCTPTLKYNPMVIPNPSDFAPIQSSNKLDTLPEEPSRLTTPPPKDKKVNFDDDVIEIDSDDDDNSTIPTCSPYHKCYTVTKTPPCVLRKNFHRAEKNYREIVEFTEREKMYKPDVVELMEKLELSTNMTTKLQEEIELMKNNSKEKDLEMELLLFKIRKSEEEFNNARIDMETNTQEYNKRLTDCEVSYEILQKKAKLREEELLSLLEEQKVKKPEDIGKLPANQFEKDRISFMDMSKDISLVNSDNESSITVSNEEGSCETKNLAITLQDQLITKCQTICQLEANIESQKRSIEYLEQSSCDLQKLIDNFKEKNTCLENENQLYKSNIIALNETINEQKESLKIAHNDIALYKETIQELQQKLTEKNKLLHLNVDYTDFETMIANEEQILANNENLKNLIYSFKTALDDRNKQIQEMKSSIDEKENPNNNSLSDDVNDKIKQISVLNEEIAKLKDDTNNNIVIINNLVRENSNFACVEEELNKKMTELENQTLELTELKKENILQIDNLNEINQRLLLSLSDKDAQQQQCLLLNSELQHKLDEMSLTITEMENEITVKNGIINSLSKLYDDKQEYENHAKSAIEKLNSVISVLSGDIQEIPEFIENCVTLFNALSNGLCLLENVATDIISEKNVIVNENSQLKSDITNLRDKYDLEKTTHQQDIDELKNVIEMHMKDIVNLKETNKNLNEEMIIEYRKELSTKNCEYETLMAQCNSYKEEINKFTEESLQNQEILRDKDAQWKLKIDDLEVQLQNSKVSLIKEQDYLKAKENILLQALQTTQELENELKNKHETIVSLTEKSVNLVQSHDQQIENIYNRICNISNRVNDDNVTSCQSSNLYENVLLLLENIKNEDLTNDNDLNSASIAALLEANQYLNNQVTKLDNDNKVLKCELERNNSEMSSLSKKLTESNTILEQLKSDLELKVVQIQMMENKALKFKDQFTDHDIAMNNRLQDLRYENELLKAHYKVESQINSESSPENLDAYPPSNVTVSQTKQPNLNIITPPSLLTICCNKIVDIVEPKQNDSDLATSSNSESESESRNTKTCATCYDSSVELRILKQEKCSLLGILEQTERTNKELLLEQENIRHDIKSLLEPAQELHKKISSHKTNLSILTATTYAENRSLKSQVLALKHHHGKVLNLCQCDIPEFKKQLCDLFVILKNDQQIENLNANYKRYSLPDVLDSNTTDCNFKNDSTLDGDLLMLDTNVTITTTGDNTLVGSDQTCLDLTQSMVNEVSCQTTDANKTEANLIPTNISLLEHDNQNMFSSLQILKEENSKLRTLIDNMSVVNITGLKVDALTSPIKLSGSDVENVCVKCQIQDKLLTDANIEEVKRLTKKLEDIEVEYENIDRKYNDLMLEMPKTDALVTKLNTLEKEYEVKSTEVTKLTSMLNVKNKEIKRLQDENDTLSTQVMENISEADDLNKELSKMKNANRELIEKVQKLESTNTIVETTCGQCLSSLIGPTHSVPSKENPHKKLNRSLSDSDTSSRFNKICTLQSELCAGREDCEVLTEHVATIKQHLNCSNMSVDLDESMGDSNASQSKSLINPNSQQIMMSSMPDIQEEKTSDIYRVERIDCYNYFLETTGEEHENVPDSLKIIDILKMFYNSILEKHGEEIEILAKRIKEYEELQNTQQTQSDALVTKYTAKSETLVENVNRVSKIMSQMKCDINHINNEFNKKDDKTLGKVIDMFKQKFLKTLDYEFGISSACLFESIISSCGEEINRIKEQYSNIKHKEADVDTVEQLKRKLSEKEVEYNLLKAAKEKMVEISGAVTLDIVKREEDINKTLNEACQKLLQNKLITPEFDLSKLATNNIDTLIDQIIIESHSKQTSNQELEKEIERLRYEIHSSRTNIDEKEKELIELKGQIESLRDINNNVTTNLAEKEEKYYTLNMAYETLIKDYDCKVQENMEKIIEVNKIAEEVSTLKEKLNQKESLILLLSQQNVKSADLEDLAKDLKDNNAILTAEISSLKEIIKNKESLISSLTEKNTKTTELLLSIKDLQEDNKKLKSVNQMISQEKESYGIDLQKSNETIKQNIAEIEKMTSDILILRESVKDATSTIGSLKQDIQKITKVNAELEYSLEEKRRECVRLEMNIKTHDKTAELQSKMIIRLNKQKQEDDVMINEKATIINEKETIINEKETIINEKETIINEVNEKYNTLQEECGKLKNAKELLEVRILELQETLDRPRSSLDAADLSRRRRQSIHDSKRLLKDLDEQRHLEAVFGSRPKPDDLFSEGDDTSGRSTPFGPGKGHDSLLSRTDHSDRDEDSSSRPSSVQAARLRRQSIHDLHRGVVRHTPSPHDLSGKLNEESHPGDSSDKKNDPIEASRLRSQLSSCRQELEDLRERYRELDEECDTCAEYLREREEQCARLKKEKTALEKQIAEYKSNSSSCNEKPSVANVAVNTDEDWANLHSVVVDRMSYDAEVEKNKRLTKTIEELRFQKQDLKNTMAKMQKALEKQQSSKDNRELESTKKELKSVKVELEELRTRYKELDEECETCAEYLKEREEQCRRLKEAKAALEIKLQELQEDSHTLAHYSARKKRQSVHDKNRNSVMDQSDASTETSEDLQSSQVERDGSSIKETDDKLREIKHLKMVVDKLSHQKSAMEQQLRSAQAAPAPQPMYVATGSAIVQNQQLTDVMKENQRLKKINAKLVNICKKRGKSDANRENEDPWEQG